MQPRKYKLNANVFSFAARQTKVNTIDDGGCQKGEGLLVKEENNICRITPRRPYKFSGYKNSDFSTLTLQYDKWKGQRSSNQDLLYESLGKRFDTLESHFETEEEAKENVTVPVKSDEFLFVLTYVDRRVTRIKIDDVLSDTNLCWLMAAALIDIEDNGTILESHKLHPQNWMGMGLELLVQI